MFARLRGNRDGGQPVMLHARTDGTGRSLVRVKHTRHASPATLRASAPVRDVASCAAMTIDQIVAAIRALPVLERLRVIELVAHDAANHAPVAEEDQHAPPAGALLTERHGLLLVDAEAALPEAAFDHRVDRDARADRIWSGS